MKSDIRKISLLIRKEYYEEVLFQIGKSELIHLSRGKAVKIDLVDDIILRKENRIRNLLTVIQTIMSDVDAKSPQLNISSIGNILVNETLDENIDEDESHLNKIRKKMDQSERVRSLILQKSDSIEKELQELKDIESVMQKNDLVTGMNLLSIMFGSISEAAKSPLDAIDNTFIVKQYGSYVIGLSVVNQQDELKKYLNTLGFVDKSEMVQSPDVIRKKINILEKRKITLEKRNIRIDNSIKALKEKWKKSIVVIYNRYHILINTYDARKSFLFSDETVYINGWINYLNKSRIEEMLGEICGNSFFMNIMSKVEMKQFRSEIPVVLRNFKLFKPFELLVKNMGLPENKEIDPTPFTAITYVIMFGVMFGDVGQGLVLVFTGLLLKIVARKKNITEGFLPDGGGILIFCGISASIFGLLWGSVFSNEHLLPALWFHPMEHMMDLFFATIMMGAAFIVIGLTFNIINSFFYGHIDESIFGTKGLMGLISYCGIIFIFFRFIQYNIQPAFWQLIAFLVVPVGVFSIRNVLAYIFMGHRPMFTHGLFEYIVETAVEIIEMFSSFLGNTISFIRAGAFALSHAGLSIAIYTLAHIITPEGYSIGSIAVLVVGNVFIILLEGLVCGIQSMRLEYYEFFGKFFHGEGVEFKPFSLEKKING